MVVKLLGIGDLLAAVVVVMMHYDLVGWRIGLLFAAYLLIKGFMFKGDFSSILDMVCGAYIIIMMFGLTTIVDWIVVLYLFQKSVFSIAA